MRAFVSPAPLLLLLLIRPLLFRSTRDVRLREEDEAEDRTEGDSCSFRVVVLLLLVVAAAALTRPLEWLGGGDEDKTVAAAAAAAAAAEDLTLPTCGPLLPGAAAAAAEVAPILTLPVLSSLCC